MEEIDRISEEFILKSLEYFMSLEKSKQSRTEMYEKIRKIIQKSGHWREKPRGKPGIKNFHVDN